MNWKRRQMVYLIISAGNWWREAQAWHVQILTPVTFSAHLPVHLPLPTLSTQCLILVFEPTKDPVKMFRFGLRTVLVNNIEVCINRLHGQKTAEAASSTPTHDQIQSRHILSSNASLPQTSEVPLPVIFHQQVHFDSAALPLSENPKLGRKQT